MIKLHSSSRKNYKAHKVIAAILFVIVTCYLGIMYLNIPVVSDLRDLYIETAMSTMEHQWLATYFIPDSVIDKVINKDDTFKNDSVHSSKLPDVTKDSLLDLAEYKSKLLEYSANKISKEYFYKLYYEIDETTLPTNLDYKNVGILSSEDGYNIKTIYGDSVFVLDTVNGIIIVDINENGYKGKLAIIKDSSKVYLHNNTRKSRGSTVIEHCDEAGAILGINGSGFIDYNGKGTGAQPVGLVISNGDIYNNTFGAAGYHIAALDNNNNFVMGRSIDLSNLRDAVEFYPIIVLNGDKHVTGSYGLGLQPRSAIGQTADGSFLMLVIDGRQVGHSLGATVSNCADIMLRYGAYNAINLDGGSSSSMVYNGEMITKTSSPMKYGRYLPNSWVVKGECYEK